MAPNYDRNEHLRWLRGIGVDVANGSRKALRDILDVTQDQFMELNKGESR